VTFPEAEDHSPLFMLAHDHQSGTAHRRGIASRERSGAKGGRETGHDATKTATGTEDLQFLNPAGLIGKRDLVGHVRTSGGRCVTIGER
jgi:hypothetical protein